MSLGCHCTEKITKYMLLFPKLYENYSQNDHVTPSMAERERQRERQRDRQTDRQTETGRDKEAREYESLRDRGREVVYYKTYNKNNKQQRHY